MKNKNLSNAISNIDLKYVEEARNYTAKRMNLTKIVSLAACIAIIVTAIPAALILNRDSPDENLPVVTTPNEVEVNGSDMNTDKTPVQIIYCDAETAAEIKKAQNKDVEIRDISEIETDLSSKVGDIEASADIPARLYKTIGGKDYIFNFTSAYTTNLSTSSKEYMKKQGSVAVYEIEGVDFSGAQMEYCLETGKITSLWLRPFSDSAAIDGELTKEQITLIADRELTAIYGEDFTQTYPHEQTYVWTEGVYTVEYRRMMSGYPTTEAVRVFYDFKGELILVATDNLDSFDCIDDSLNLNIETILEAEKDALELIDQESGTTGVIHDKKLTVDKEGDVYLYVVYEKINEYNKPLTLTLYYKIG